MTASGHMTTAEKQAVLALYGTKVDGEWPSIRYVSQQTGRSVSAVGNLVRREGVYRPENNPLTAAEEKRIIELHQTRNGPRRPSVAEISRMVGRSQATVANVIAGHTTGKPRRTKTNVKRRRRAADIRARSKPKRQATTRVDNAKPPKATAQVDEPKPPKAMTNPPCVGVCSFACTKRCALSQQVGDRAQPPGSSTTSGSNRRREPGIRYARTGLKLPAPGHHSRFSP